MIVKICGITRPEDAEDAVRAGADWLGLNFWPGSKRCISVERGRSVAAAARRAARQRGNEQGTAGLRVVGVFVNQPADAILATVRQVGLDAVQLHGDETPEACAALVAVWQSAAGAGVGTAIDIDIDNDIEIIKAVALGSRDDVAALAGYPLDTVVVDTPTAGYGGSGRVFDWALARAAVATGKRVLLAGGLGPENVARAVAEVAPFGVDVASGVESAPGIKDQHKMQAFVTAAKGAAAKADLTAPATNPEEKP